MMLALALSAFLASAGFDSIPAAASAALRAGEPWRATRIVAPLLDRPGTRTPEVVLLAARAAAGWEGWETVTRLLAGQPWLDGDDAAGRALLARALLERADAAAAGHAARALVPSLPEPERGRRLVVLARALERAGRMDSAATSYLQAAEALPAVGDWLRLRAAGVTRDSSARAALYAGLTVPPAQARVRWTEALARDRFGDQLGASRLYASLGATLASLRLRLAAASGDSARVAVRRELIAWLGGSPPAGEVSEGIAMLDRAFPNLAAADQLVVARRAAAAGLLTRANQGFTRAEAAGRLSDGDRFTHGTVLARLGRHEGAVARFESVREPARLAEARYQRARSLFRLGQPDRAMAALRTVRDSFPGDVTTGSTAGWLHADTWVDRGDDPGARREMLAVARRYPASPQGDRAAFQAALIAWIGGDHATAAREWDTLADRSGPEQTAAIYWSGRAWAEAGDTGRARQRWQSLLRGFVQSYYVVPAARQLGVPPFSVTAPEVPPRGTPPGALSRAALLDSLGMGVEARFELERFSRDASGDALAPAGRALLDAGHPSRAIQLAIRATGQGQGGAQFLRLLYPLINREVLERESAALGLDPMLVAGLIRQESLYDPRARSRADARGLMQVLPSVGAAAARSEGYPEWDAVLLYQPDVNMHIGLNHLAERWAKCGGSVEAALAAYNAGSDPVNRWLRRPGTADPEIFIERIPYVETRDYVRRVLYNQARYTSLHAR